MKKLKVNVLGYLYFIVAVSLVACGNKSEVDPKGNGQNNLEISYSPEDAMVGTPVVFSSGASPNSSWGYEWDFGDEHTSTEVTPTHAYEEVGDYKVALTVTDEEGKKTEKFAIIKVGMGQDIPGRLSLREAMAGMGNNVWVCAHRAYDLDDVHPENSMASIKSSIENGIEMIEIDIRQTKEGELILIHDATIDRTTSGKGSVASMTLEELQSYNLLHDGRFTNQVIPTFTEVLKETRGKIYLDLDIKIENYQKIYEVVKQYGMLSQVAFTIDDIALSKSLMAQNKELVLMPIARNEEDFNRYKQADLNIALFQFNNTTFKKEYIDEAREMGSVIFRNVYINTSLTPENDNYKQIDQTIALKGSIIQTDHALKIKEYLKSKGLN